MKFRDANCQNRCRFFTTKILLLPLACSLRAALTKNPARKTAHIILYSAALKNLRGQKRRDVEYWANNLFMPVLLASAINAAIDDGHRIFLEVLSHSIDAHSIHEILVAYVEMFPTLLRNLDSQ